MSNYYSPGVWKDKFKSTLQNKYLEYRQKNHRVSLRSYALKLGISSGALSEYLSGKRQPSATMAVELLEKMSISEKEYKSFRELMGFSENKDVVVLSLDHYEIIEDWRYLAVRNIFVTDCPPISYLDIAQSLDLQVDEVEKVCAKLIGVGLLEGHPDHFASIHHNGKSVSTVDGVTNESLKRSHQNTLENASKKLIQLDAGQRDFTKLVFTADRSQLPLVKKEIRKFYERMRVLMQGSSNNDVFEMSVHLYPLTEERGNKQ